MLKKFVCVGLGLLLALSLAGCKWFAKEEVAAPQPEPERGAPSAAVAGLIESLRDFDSQRAGDYVTGRGIDQVMDNNYTAALRGILGRLDYRVTGEAVTGDTAWVEVEITAVDLNDVAASMMVELAKQVALGALKGERVEMVPFVQDYFANKVKPQKLRTVDTPATVYLVLDEQGQWRVDLDNDGNLEFLNALTGGFIDTVNQVRQYLADFGIG